jgi:hypothetical protein
MLEKFNQKVSSFHFMNSFCVYFILYIYIYIYIVQPAGLSRVCMLCGDNIGRSSDDANTDISSHVLQVSLTLISIKSINQPINHCPFLKQELFSVPFFCDDQRWRARDPQHSNPAIAAAYIQQLGVPKFVEMLKSLALVK